MTGGISGIGRTAARAVEFDPVGMDFGYIPFHAGLIVIASGAYFAFDIETGAFLHPFFNERN